MLLLVLGAVLILGVSTFFLGIFTLLQAFSIIHGISRYLKGVLRASLVLIFPRQKVVGAPIYAFSMSGGAARKRCTRAVGLCNMCGYSKRVYGALKRQPGRAFNQTKK